MLDVTVVFVGLDFVKKELSNCGVVDHRLTASFTLSFELVEFDLSSFLQDVVY